MPLRRVRGGGQRTKETSQSHDLSSGRRAAVDGCARSLGLAAVLHPSAPRCRLVVGVLMMFVGLEGILDYLNGYATVSRISELMLLQLAARS